MWLLGASAAIAHVLAVVGLYGLLSHMVGQRRREFAIRLAVGARAPQIAGSVVRHAIVLTGIGLLTGLAASAGLMRVLRSLLFEVRPTDPIVLTTIAVLLFGIALLASYLPVRQAARIDPIAVLRVD